jgi:hypothetical protein
MGVDHAVPVGSEYRRYVAALSCTSDADLYLNLLSAGRSATALRGLTFYEGKSLADARLRPESSKSLLVYSTIRLSRSLRDPEGNRQP